MQFSLKIVFLLVALSAIAFAVFRYASTPRVIYQFTMAGKTLELKSFQQRQLTFSLTQGNLELIPATMCGIASDVDGLVHESGPVLEKRYLALEFEIYSLLIDFDQSTYCFFSNPNRGAILKSDQTKWSEWLNIYSQILANGESLEKTRPAPLATKNRESDMTKLSGTVNVSE